MYRNDTEGEILLRGTKILVAGSFYYLKSVLLPSITDLIRAKSLLLCRKNHSESIFTDKITRRTHNFEFVVKNNEYNLSFQALTWNAVLAAMFVMIWEIRTAEDVHAKFCLQALLLGLVHWWLKPILSSTTQLKMQKPRCYVIFSSTEHSSPSIPWLFDDTWVVTQSGTYISAGCWKKNFTAQKLFWEIHRAKNLFRGKYSIGFFV